MATFDEMDRRLAAAPAVLARELHTAMTASLLLIEGDARQNAGQTSYDTGRLAGSIQPEIRGSGLNLEGRVGPSVRYGAVREFGGKWPGKMPPVAALMGWVRRHPRPGPTNRSPRTQAFLLARAIKRRGIKAKPFLRPAYQHNRTAIRGLFQRAGARVVAHLRGRAL